MFDHIIDKNLRSFLETGEGDYENMRNYTFKSWAEDNDNDVLMSLPSKNYVARETAIYALGRWNLSFRQMLDYMRQYWAN